MNKLNNNALPWAQRNPKKFLALFSFLTIGLFQCYSLRLLNPTAIKLFNNIIIVCLIVYLFKMIFTYRKSVPFYNTFRLITISIFLSIISCWLMNGQSIPLSFTVVSRNVMIIIVFFWLYKLEPDVSTLEKYILIFAFIFILLWLYALSQAPIPTFISAEEEVNNSRGIYRINFVGRGYLVIAMFLSLNKFVVLRKKIWFFLTTLFFIFIVLQVTRQLIICSALVGLAYYFYTNIKKCIIIILSSILLSQFVSVSVSDDSVIGAMINRTEQQIDNQQEDDDIRVKEYIFYFTEYNTNFITMIFGNGLFNSNSNFGKKEHEIEHEKKYYLSDVGYAAMYGILGILGLVAYCMLFYKGAMRKISGHLMYARLFYIFMIPTNIAASWFMKPDFSIILAICAYLFIYDWKKNYINYQKQIS